MYVYKYVKNCGDFEGKKNAMNKEIKQKIKKKNQHYRKKIKKDK